jgi:type II secretory pathway component GspD/PulD (secretin)
MKLMSNKFLLGTALLLSLGACTDQRPGFEREQKSDISDQAAVLSEKSSIMRNGGAVDANRPFLGRNMAMSSDQFEVDNGKPLPAAFQQPGALEISTPEMVRIEQVAVLLEELSGLNVVVRTRYQSGEEELRIPINSRMRLNHKGTLGELVEKVSSHFDLAWKFDGKTITFDRMDTRTYDLPLPTSSGNITTSLSGVNIGGNSVSSSKKIEMDPWSEIEDSLKAVVKDPGVVSVSRNSGQVTIFAPKSVQEQAVEIVKTFDDLYSRRIGLEIATFFVDTQKGADFGVDFGVAGKNSDLKARTGSGMESLVGTTTTGLSKALEGGIGVLTAGDAEIAFNIRDLAKNNSVADYQAANTIAQNGVVAPVVLTNSKKYVSEISPGTDKEAPKIKTENINSGISIYALPRLMKNGKIQLSVWVTQSELNRLDTFDTGSGFVQLPDADQRAMEYTLIMEPGETLVMGGYEQEHASSESEKGVGGVGSLGAKDKRKGGTTKTRMVLMVRPSLIGN